MKSKSPVVVLGCGVSGLTCAVALAEAGRAVEIWTRELPERTTSCVAGAIWYPFRVGPAERVEPWSRQTYSELVSLAAEPRTGVSMHRGLELLPPGVTDGGAAHRTCSPELRELPHGAVPSGFAHAFELSVPVAEMPIYLAYLLRRFEHAGGSVLRRTVKSLDEAFARSEVVVNCVGLGARELVGDRLLRAVRGQVLRVEKCGVDTFVLDDYDPRGVTYIIPRSNDCVLGGTADADEEELTPDESATKAILQRCRELDPRLAHARVLSIGVGLRPVRESVRLEREQHPKGVVIHNYGHGGGGLTLSWGCAFDVLALA